MKKTRTKYKKPTIERIAIDKNITLVMQSSPPDNPDPRGDPSGSKGGTNEKDPFSSPFKDSPFG